MKIIFVTTNCYLPQLAGGSETCTNDLCQSLIAKNHECAVLARIGEGGFIWFKNRVMAKLTGKKFVADTFSGYSVFRGWEPENEVLNVFEKFKPDVAIIVAGQKIKIAEKLVKLNIKTIIYLHDVEFNSHGGQYQKLAGVSFISNSEYTAKKFKGLLGLSSTVIPPLVNFDAYKVNSKREKVLFINPVPIKGVELAFRLAENNSDIDFLFVQSWPLDARELFVLERRAEQLDNIVFLKKQSDMKKVYSQAKLLLVPSLCDEAWGRVVTEAQVSGIPALASNRGGLPESVGNGGVLLDPECDYQVWHDVLRRFWFDDDFYNSYANNAIQYSQRMDIQPDFIISKFIEFIKSN